MNDYTQTTKEQDIPFYKRMEYWNSPLAVFLVIGYIIFGILYALYWVALWLIFSCIRPFTNSKFFCNMGMHKYRYDDKPHSYNKMICKICKKEKIVNDYV